LNEAAKFISSFLRNIPELSTESYYNWYKLDRDIVENEKALGGDANTARAIV